MSDLTGVFTAANRGDKAAVNQLFAEFYPELRRLAHARLRKGEPLSLLDTTSLVHESYCRVVQAGQIQMSDRPHFMGYAARVMRTIIVDFFRERSAQRRGGDNIRVELESPAVGAVFSDEAAVLRIHEALNKLESIDDRLARVVEMRYFAGMAETEIAQALGINERTVRRDWEKARVLLAAELA
jgi:RNA polymerase sigma factor (TIGR02999 family)